RIAVITASSAVHVAVLAVRSSNDPEVNVLWRAVLSVDRDHVLWAGRHHDGAIHLRPKNDPVTGTRGRLLEGDAAFCIDRDVHPEIEGGGAFRRCDANLAHGV